MQTKFGSRARRCLLVPLLFVAACSGRNVEAALVGTWQLDVPNPQGVARWVWDIRANGTYAFHAEGPGDVPSHSGTFAATNGRYTLQSTTSFVWADTGTYALENTNTLKATGKLGTATWLRFVLPPIEPRSSAIFAFFAKQPFEASQLSAPFTSPRVDTVEPDAQASSDGVVGLVRTVVQGLDIPSDITITVYRNRAMAEAAYAMNAVFDAPTFRSALGEMVGAHSYSYGAKRAGKCLSRIMDSRMQDASVTCYLLVEYPVPEAVIVSSMVHERHTGTNGEATDASFDRAIDLMLAAMKQWEGTYAKMPSP